MIITTQAFLQAIDGLMSNTSDIDHKTQVILDYISQNSDKPELLNASALASKRTALTMAVIKGIYPIVEAITAISGIVNIEDADGCLPLIRAAYAAQPYRPKMLDILLNVSDIDINKADSSGANALFYAIDQCNMMAVQSLLDRGARLSYDNIALFLRIKDAIHYNVNNEQYLNDSVNIFSKLAEFRKKEQLLISESKHDSPRKCKFLISEEAFSMPIKAIVNATSSTDLTPYGQLIQNYAHDLIEQDEILLKVSRSIVDAGLGIMKLALRRENDCELPLIKKKCSFLFDQAEYLMVYRILFACKEGRVPEVLNQHLETIRDAKSKEAKNLSINIGIANDNDVHNESPLNTQGPSTPCSEYKNVFEPSISRFMGTPEVSKKSPQNSSDRPRYLAVPGMYSADSASSDDDNPCKKLFMSSDTDNSDSEDDVELPQLPFFAFSKNELKQPFLIQVDPTDGDFPSVDPFVRSGKKQSPG